ncbi:hypothetical protein KY290_017245, partial [Solanum tuberosum]
IIIEIKKGTWTYLLNNPLNALSSLAGQSGRATKLLFLLLSISPGRDGGCLAFAAAVWLKFLVRTNEKNRKRQVDIAWYDTSPARREVEIEEGNKKEMRGATSFGGEAVDVR